MGYVTARKLRCLKYELESFRNRLRKTKTNYNSG